jgi:phosphohistidine phosphatase
LIRHAEAEDPAPMSSDYERQLTTRGIMDSAKIGGHFLQQGISPDIWISSSADRTLMTAKVIMERLKMDTDSIISTRDLYGGGLQAYLKAVNNVPAECNIMALIGHNPDISYFAEYLTHDDFISMSKCGVMIITFEGLEWAEISGRSGKFEKYFTPKTLLTNQ